MKYEVILSLDPSGNYNEGKGTTGWCLYDVKNMKVLQTDYISAKDYECQEDYWNAHLLRIVAEFNFWGKDRLGLLVEDYVLYMHKSATQTNSRMETPKVIGVIEHFAWQNGFKCHKQPAHEVKNRWADPILEHEGIIEKKGDSYVLPGQKTRINRHCKDAIRHAVHFGMFKNKEEK